ncbi:MAG TPA: hypothetical protein VGL21_01670 [Jatrophihabitantaceae bacterium]|jgi:hypothetical protein
MNTTLNAAFASDRQHQLITAAAEYRRGSTVSHRRSHRVSAFLKDLAAASR